MVYSIHRWVTHLLRPKLTQVNIRVLFDGKEVNACSLSDIQLIALSKSIEELCKVNKHSLYWFEVECYEKSSCTKKPDSSLYLICYTEDKTKSSFKRKIDIPPRFRKQFFNKKHFIQPHNFGYKFTTSNIQVQFVIDQNM